MNNLKFLLLSFVFLITSCGATIKNTWVKEGYTPRSFNNILVLNISKDRNIRSAYERAAVTLFKADGVNSTPGMEVFPLKENLEKISPKTIENRILEGNYDAILISSVVGVELRNKSDYFYENQLRSYYYPYASPYRDYIKHTYVYSHTSDFDREERQYVVESRLFDAKETSKEKAIIWSGSTKISNPTELENVAEQYAQLVVHSLLKEGIVLKP